MDMKKGKNIFRKTKIEEVFTCPPQQFLYNFHFEYPNVEETLLSPDDHVPTIPFKKKMKKMLLPVIGHFLKFCTLMD